MSVRQKKPIGKVRRGFQVAGLCVVALLLGFHGWLNFVLTPEQRFQFYFDITSARVAPLVADIMGRDPALHAAMLRESKAAYDRGGWSAASARFQQLRYELIQVYADDGPTIACAAARAAATRSLLNRPASCRAFMAGDNSDGAAMDAERSVGAACDDALQNAERRRQAGAKLSVMPADAYRAAVLKTFASPDPLSTEERTAFLSTSADDRLYCRAVVKLEENALAQPPEQAARFLRSGLVKQAPDISLDSVLPVTAPPDSLHCAAAGTVFTLSMEESKDGKPITWQSLGQDGWDCRLKSSATGERPLWGDARSNPLRLLWPLEVGKSADVPGPFSDGPMSAMRVRVASLDRYWLPIGWVQAYAIEETAMEGGGVWYVLTRYWSPKLGFQIGQKLVVQAGPRPDWVAPDWQIIAEK